MAAPSLAFTASAAGYTDSDNGAVQVFYGRAGYQVQAEDSKFNAWADWANSSGSADEKTLAGKYSGYAFTTFFNLGGVSALGAALGSAYEEISNTAQTAVDTPTAGANPGYAYDDTWPSSPDPEWFPEKSGFCMRDLSGF